MSKSILRAIVVSATALATQASAGFFDITEGYNILTFGDFIVTKSDQIEGKVAAQGNVELTQSSINYADSKIENKRGLKAVVSGGDVTLTGGVVYGSVYAANNAKVVNPTILGDVWAKNITQVGDGQISGTSFYTESAQIVSYGKKQQVDNIPVIVDFSQKQTDAINLSIQLSGQGSKVFKDASGVLNLKDIPDEEVIFYTVDAEDLSGVSSLYFENLEKQYVINVDGNGSDIILNSINRKNYQTSDDFNFSNVLFNFRNASSLTIGSFYGNILAADIDVYANDGEMYGTLVSQSYSGKTEFHLVTPGDFNPPPPPKVPESSTTTMLVAGAIFILFLSRKNALVRK
jgi:choice-of-anchor A domain-containing protein